MIDKIYELCYSAKNVIDNVDVNHVDKNIHVMCYISYDCEDDDTIEDIFQALIDILCVEASRRFGDVEQMDLTMMYPGAVADDSIYESGDKAFFKYYPMEKRVEVMIYRYNKNEYSVGGAVQPVVYNYDA